LRWVRSASDTTTGSPVLGQPGSRLGFGTIPRPWRRRRAGRS
jgi:hypothetical protein